MNNMADCMYEDESGLLALEEDLRALIQKVCIVCIVYTLYHTISHNTHYTHYTHYTHHITLYTLYFFIEKLPEDLTNLDRVLDGCDGDDDSLGICLSHHIF